ncbi:MAG: phage major capsid protein [Anaerorhabdus sp.]|uniref:phage major capsid family protein n=1 Tax=Anaerorhabdus sp. TaxID=1872524 RepID=UPI002FC84E30
MAKRKYDFAGWVTKNDIRCSDGVTIKHDAFKDNHEGKVPLIWNHDSQNASNVLGHVIMHNEDQGVYGYGYFNDTEEGQHAKAMVNNGDISAMSIAANKLVKKGQDVIHGMIYEVSLVLAGANPGALIETVLNHSGEEENGKAIIHTGMLIHPGDDVLSKDEGGTEVSDNLEHAGETIGEVLDTLTPTQRGAVETLLANLMPEEEDEIKQSDNLDPDEEDEELDSEDKDKNTTTTTTTVVKQKDDGGETMKQNIFNAKGEDTSEELKHAAEVGSVILADTLAGNGSLKENALKHSITNIEILFPDAKVVGNAPILYHDQNTASDKIMAGVRKSPFSRVKTIIADLTKDEARALGYIKGNEKAEQVFELLSRETTAQTVYKKQKLDRDDVIDITDYNVIGFINMEMRMQLNKELARAILVGDGRLTSDPNKIKADKIRPIITDDDLYTIKKSVATVVDMIEGIIKAMADYQGSGVPDMFINHNLLADLKLLKDSTGRFLFGNIPTTAAVAAMLGVGEIIPTTYMGAGHFLIVNLNDYTLGATKGGEVTTFEDFDIDFNQHKYLIETRVSGALTTPKAAIYGTVTSATTTTTSK